MFGFFSFFLYAKVVMDELFLLHVRKAATRAFFIGVVVMAPIIGISFEIESSAWLRLLLIIPFLFSMLIFVISLEIFEQREKKGLEEDDVIN